jgi:hypothetical protein
MGDVQPSGTMHYHPTNIRKSRKDFPRLPSSPTPGRGRVKPSTDPMARMEVDFA